MSGIELARSKEGREVLIRRDQIITHRGLEPDKEDFYSESTVQAFADQLRRGFGGIEFDANFTSDGKVVVVHDSNLRRITGGRDERSFLQVHSSEIFSIQLPNGRLAFLEEVMDLIGRSGSQINALHLKGRFQEQPYLGTLLEELRKYPDQYSRFFIFDIKPEAARIMRREIEDLVLAPSVAHLYDIQRYNQAVAGTLISIEEALKLRELFDWVWLDEWDLADANGGSKKFYTGENFQRLREAGYRIGLVTPELHGTSPGLLGGEAHPDAKSDEKLFARIKEILLLKPDAICTDHPEKVLTL